MNEPGWAIPLLFGLVAFVYCVGRNLRDELREDITAYVDGDLPGLGASLLGALVCAGLLAVLIF